VRIHGLSIAFESTGDARQTAPCPAALETEGAVALQLTGLKVIGGVQINGGHSNVLGWSAVSNPFGVNAAAPGTCVHVASCGNATTLETCNTTIHDNNIHDCRDRKSVV
jgi:hypothetical protein